MLTYGASGYWLSYVWLSKLWSPIIILHLILLVPKRGHNFDNHPSTSHPSFLVRIAQFKVCSGVGLWGLWNSGLQSIFKIWVFCLHTPQARSLPEEGDPSSCRHRGIEMSRMTEGGVVSYHEISVFQPLAILKGPVHTDYNSGR